MSEECTCHISLPCDFCVSMKFAEECVKKMFMVFDGSTIQELIASTIRAALDQERGQVCEWVRNPKCGFENEGCNERFYTKVESQEFNYCPQCGKKIKVKEEAK